MMIDYEKIRNLVECEIDKISKKDQLTENSLQVLDKLVDIRKDLDELEMNDGIADYYENWDGNSYARGRSYRRGYNRGGNSYTRGRYGGNSYDVGHDDMIEHLHYALDNAANEKEREAIRMTLEKVQNI